MSILPFQRRWQWFFWSFFGGQWFWRPTEHGQKALSDGWVSETKAAEAFFIAVVKYLTYIPQENKAHAHTKRLKEAHSWRQNDSLPTSPTQEASELMGNCGRKPFSHLQGWVLARQEQTSRGCYGNSRPLQGSTVKECSGACRNQHNQPSSSSWGSQACIGGQLHLGCPLITPLVLYREEARLWKRM